MTQMRVDEPNRTTAEPAVAASTKQVAVLMESDLRLLKGLMTILRYLGERPAADAIEPFAIAALANPAEDAVDRLIALNRAAAGIDDGLRHR